MRASRCDAGGVKTTDLTEQIEKLVRDHLAQVRADAAAAVDRAFEGTTTPTKRSRPTRQRAPGRRRDPAALAELAERLHAEIMAAPGESMAVYAEQLHAGVRELHRPMTLLKRAGRLRTTGVRNNTRYYPTPGS